MHKESGLAVLTLPKASRALCVGATGTGKSTIAELLLKKFLQENPTAISLVLDSKPRFQAEYELNGLTTKASRRYAKWDYGSFFPDSFRLPLTGNLGHELDTVWKRGGRVAIAQVSDREQWGLLADCARTFYEKYGAKRPRILYVDEQADFFEVMRLGGIFQQTARSGRERNITYVAATQRPRFIPKVLLTEVSRIYLFELEYSKDRDHMAEVGIPKELAIKPEEHSFLYWDKALKTKAPSGLIYQLDLPKE